MNIPVSVCIFIEPVIVELVFRNPLKVSLALSNVLLLWSFTLDNTPLLKERSPEELTITNEEPLAPGVSQ